MRIVTWNVNSIGARLPRVLELLDKHAPDVVLLQETKCADDAFPTEELLAAGYASAPHGAGPVRCDHASAAACRFYHPPALFPAAREPRNFFATAGQYVAAGADILTVHVEAAVHIHRVLQRLGGLENANRPGEGIVRGLALDPGTPLEWLEPLLDEIDVVTLLAIDPGWGGQKFAPATFDRVARTKQMVAAAGKEILVCVDGGVTKENIAAIAAAGADLVVTGSAVFDG